MGKGLQATILIALITAFWFLGRIGQSFEIFGINLTLSPIFMGLSTIILLFIIITIVLLSISEIGIIKSEVKVNI